MASSFFSRIGTYICESLFNSRKRSREDRKEPQANGSSYHYPYKADALNPYDFPDEEDTIREIPAKKFKSANLGILTPANRMNDRNGKSDHSAATSARNGVVLSGRKPISSMGSREPASAGSRRHTSNAKDSRLNPDPSRRMAFGAPESRSISTSTPSLTPRNENTSDLECVGLYPPRTGNKKPLFTAPRTSPPLYSRNNSQACSDSSQSSFKMPNFRDVTANQPKTIAGLHKQKQQSGSCSTTFKKPLEPKSAPNSTSLNGTRLSSAYGSDASLNSAGSSTVQKYSRSQESTTDFLCDMKKRLAKSKSIQDISGAPLSQRRRDQSPVVITISDEQSVQVLPKAQLKPFLDQISKIRKKRDAELRHLAENYQKNTPSIRRDVKNYQEYEDMVLSRSRLSTEVFTRRLEQLTERVQQIETSTPSHDIDFIELSYEEEEVVKKAFGSGSPTDVLSDKFRLQVTRKDIATLKGLSWLNDEVANFYLEMIVDRALRHPEKYPKVYTYNTFFYTTLVNKAFDGVKRWTKKVDIFSYDLLLVPVHLGSHWCLAVMDMRERRINYYDSLGKANHACAEKLLEYLQKEKSDKLKQSFDRQDWTIWMSAEERAKKIPLQNNGSDCGVFMLKFADYISRRREINFDHTNMPYFRRRICWEILQQKLMGT
ncbi:sentrin-specific protease 1-like isoform X2 [Paramacrobiotus metropolitanus]|uniref:sentrin-specific protease 1-like isoform X2 n=1 Tax=Paramacrobiotus metropolitanus TaxID=2943436 RepID=UPI0024464BFF|nr:sentrin-specific protease 1-like isoform X2 [Paramacrobiotus metropolitanus]